MTRSHAMNQPVPDRRPRRLFHTLTGVSRRAPRALLLLLLALLALGPLNVHGVGVANAAGPVITATKTASFPDHGNGKASAGDTITYAVHITNSGDQDATGVHFSDTLDPNTTLVAGSLTNTPLAVNDSYSAIGNVRIAVPAAQGVLANDVAPSGGTFTASAGTASAHGGAVALNADGSFTYNPPAGYDGADTFIYTASDGHGHTDTATVTIAVSGLIWFVDNSRGANGDGRLTSPFTCLVGSGCVDHATHAGDTIFVYSGSGAYAGGLTLGASQALIGQGARASLATITGLTPPSYSDALPATGGAAPTIAASSGADLTLGTGNLLRGVALSSSGGTALAGNGFGTFTAADDTVANSAGAAIALSNGTLAASFSSVSANGCSNTDGLALTNTTGSFAVTGDGTNSANGSGGTIQHCAGADGNTAQGIGVSLSNASGVSLSAMHLHDFDNFALYGSGVSGFTLDHTLIDGVNGTTGASPYQEASVSFAQLTGTDTFSNDTISGGRLDNVQIQNSSGTLNSLTFANCTIQNNSTSNDGNVGLQLLSTNSAVMSASVSNCQFNGNRTIALQGNAADSSTLNFAATGNTITGGTAGNNQGNQGIEDSTSLAAHGTFDINGNTISGLLNTGINVFTGNTSSLSGLIRNNTVTNAGAGSSGYGIRVYQNSYSSIRANVTGNTVSNVGLDWGILADANLNGTDTTPPSGGQAVLQIAVTNNHSSVLSGALDAIRVQARAGATACARVTGNTTNGGGSSFYGLYLRQAAGANLLHGVFQLEGLTGGAQSASAAQASAASQNPNAATVGATATDSFTGVAAGSCNIPSSQFALNTQGATQQVVGFHATYARAALSHSAALAQTAQTAQTSASVAFPAANGTFTLPAGKSITLTYQVTVNNPATAGSVSNQGNVAGGNFSTVLTDDPSTAAPNDATVTRIDQPSTTTLSSAPNPSLQGQAVLVTATVSGAAGTPSGSVQFKDNGVNLGGPAPLVNGVASINATTLSTGVHTITAAYMGDSVYDPSTGTLAPNQTVNAPATITNADHASFTIGAAGSFTVQATGFPTPSLSETGPLPSGVTFVDNGDGTATLGGTPAVGSAGVYHLTITAHNGVGADATQTFTLMNGQASAITSADHTTFTAGNANSFTVQTTGAPAAQMSETGALPGGVTFVDNGNGTATLSGTPAAGTGGSYALTITAHNGIGADATQSFTLVVNEAAAITSPANATFSVGTAGAFTVQTTGFPAPTLSETGALPGGVTFVDNGDGTATLSGTPAAGTGGSYALTITAHNGGGADAVQSFTLTVDQGAAITSPHNASFTVGANNSFTVQSSGYPAPSLSETGALPSGVTFVDNHDGTATLSGTPAVGSGGSYTLSITAHNGIGADATQSFTLVVNEAAAITSADHTTFSVGTAGAFTVQTTGYPTPSLSETGALPGGVTFVDNGDGTATLSGTPAAGSGGSYPLSIKAHNGSGADATQSFTLVVDQPSVITSADHTTFIPGVAGAFTVKTTGFPAPSLSETGALPNGVTFMDNHDGTATLGGTPDAGSGGTYHLSITAHNGIGADATQSFTLQVGQPTAITSAASSGTAFTAGAPGSFTVTSTGIPTAQLSASGALPGGVTFVDNHDGTATLSGTPASGTTGAYPLTITAHNGVGSDATQSFSLVVAKAASTIALSSATGTAVYGKQATFTAIVAPAAANTLAPSGVVTFYDNGTPIGTGTLTKGAPDTATFTTAALSVGNHSITASYGGDANFTPSGPSAAESFTVSYPPLYVLLSVTSSPAGPVTTGSTVTAHLTLGNHTTATQTVTVKATLTYRGSRGNLSFTVPLTFKLKAGQTVNQSVSFPISRYFPRGAYTLTLTAKDGGGDTATATASLTVV